MTLRGLLVRFCITYILFLVVAMMLLPFFGTKSTALVSTAALLAAVLHSGQAFLQRNGRYLTRREKWQAWSGIMSIDMVLQIVVPLLLLAGTASNFTAHLVGLIPSLAFVAILHGLAAMLALALAGKIGARKKTPESQDSPTKATD